MKIHRPSSYYQNKYREPLYSPEQATRKPEPKRKKMDSVEISDKAHSLYKESIKNQKLNA